MALYTSMCLHEECDIQRITLAEIHMDVTLIRTEFSNLSIGLLLRRLGDIMIFQKF